MSLKKWIKGILIYAVAGLFLPGQAVTADDTGAAEKFLKSNLEAVFAVLQKKDLDQPAKNKAVVDIVTPMFDFPLMAKLSLGREYWPDLSPAQRERFTTLYIERLKQVYLNKLTSYTDEKIVYESAVADKNKVQIPTQLISKDKKISMLYKLYLSDNTWKIYDVEIQGVSIFRSYKAQIKEILQKGTFDDLLEKMQKPVNNQ